MRDGFAPDVQRDLWSPGITGLLAAVASIPIGKQLITLLKRLALLVAGPAIFLFVCAAPYVCENRKGFRAWYWCLVPRSCGWLLWLLSIRVDISEGSVKRMAGDVNSLFVVNHRSHLDGFALLSNVPREKWVTFGAKKELFQKALLGRGFRAAGLVEIDRKSGSQALQVLVEAVRTMPARRSLILFPEGTRARDDGLGVFKAGAVLVARETGRSIRPVVIANSDLLLPRKAIVPRPGVIRIEVLDTFHCNAEAEVDAEVARLRGAMVQAYDGLSG
ncbi:1-acyl-sn-glycerol-3-phosphate acyltransferase [Aliiruegeria haliotis]|uniref:1-acyl-sn-glycerol-3-phosphate acyltransferase n=1 Tax=Aliiruegeria haliotis TaxID=1280846 RepID=A0A2T0RVU5_9RHOB|nr:lysophospholipid acyltransferase family protein [Aliiruegeria haliotis]PRY25315.1 1-acyl-sn-glycerol-3-phosphate acyltransferase [Aliiruegeria haliotis]